MNTESPPSLKALLKERGTLLPPPEDGALFLQKLHETLHREAMTRSTFEVVKERCTLWLQSLLRPLQTPGKVALLGSAGLVVAAFSVSALSQKESSTAHTLPAVNSHDQHGEPFIAAASPLDYSSEIPVFSVQPREF